MSPTSEIVEVFIAGIDCSIAIFICNLQYRTYDAQRVARQIRDRKSPICIHGHSVELTTLSDAQWRNTIQALSKSRGVIGGTRGVARLIGLPRTTLQYHTKNFGLEPNDYKKEIHY